MRLLARPRAHNRDAFLRLHCPLQCAYVHQKTKLHICYCMQSLSVVVLRILLLERARESVGTVLLAYQSAQTAFTTVPYWKLTVNRVIDPEQPLLVQSAVLFVLNSCSRYSSNRNSEESAASATCWAKIQANAMLIIFVRLNWKWWRVADDVCIIITAFNELTHTTNYWSTFHNYSHIQHHQSMQLHGHTPHHKPLHLQANKSSTTTSTCTIVVGTWKVTCTKLWLLVKIVKQLAGSTRALWHKSPALWSMGFAPSGKHTAALGYKSHSTRNPWYTTITLLSTPFNAHPNLQSPQTNPTIHNAQVHTTIPKQWIGNYGVCGWKDRCRDGNLRTYCHVSPI